MPRGRRVCVYIYICICIHMCLYGVVRLRDSQLDDYVCIYKETDRQLSRWADGQIERQLTKHMERQTHRQIAGQMDLYLAFEMWSILIYNSLCQSVLVYISPLVLDVYISLSSAILVQTSLYQAIIVYMFHVSILVSICIYQYILSMFVYIGINIGLYQSVLVLLIVISLYQFPFVYTSPHRSLSIYISPYLPI